MIGEFIRRLKAERDKRVREMEHRIGAGQCSSFEQYRNAVGNIKGLNDLDDLINAAMKGMEKDDE